MRYSFLLFSSLLATSVFANETTDTVRVKSIDEVTVIASPKENSPLREQALSSTLLSGNQLQERQIVSLKGISQIAPNFFMPDYGSRITSAMYIRGIGSRINNPAVGLYVDNIPYHDKSAFDFNLTDIESIEVLRGPQGTLYGRNTMGGLIKAQTRSPFTYSGTDIHLGYASGDNHRTASFTHYHHPTQKFAWYIGGYYEGSDGFFTNYVTDRKVDDMQSAGGRVRALYLATDRLKFDLNVNYDFNDEGAYPYAYQGTISAPFPEFLGYDDKIIANRESSYKRSVMNVGLNTQYEADRFTLSNVTGYQALHDRMFMDQDFICYDIYTLEQKQKLQTISDEITFKSKGNTRWNWVSGASMMYQSLNTLGPVNFMSDGVTFLEGTINSFLPTISVMGQEMPMSVTLKDKQITMGGEFDTPVLNAALFHQSTLSLTDALKLTLGLRLDYEHNELTYDSEGKVNYDFTLTSRMMPVELKNLLARPFFRGVPIKNDYLQLMPKFALQYDINKYNNVYASVSRGTRSGGYNVQMFGDLLQADMRNIMMSQIKVGTEAAIRTIAAENPRMPASVVESIIANLDKMPKGETPDVASTVTYKPEYSWNYEVGTHLTSADHRYQADAAIFFIDTRDQQIARFAESGLGRMMVNAGHSQSRGAELSLRGEPARNLNVALNYGYTYAKFKDYDCGDEDYSGNYVPFVPKHTLSIDANYSWHFNHSWANRFTIGATYSGAGRIYWTEENRSYASQQYYSLLSARATLQTKYAQIELWGRNLTDTHYNTFYFESMSRGFAQHGKPSQIGVDLRFHF